MLQNGSKCGQSTCILFILHWVSARPIRSYTCRWRARALVDKIDKICLTWTHAESIQILIFQLIISASVGKTQHQSKPNTINSEIRTMTACIYVTQLCKSTRELCSFIGLSKGGRQEEVRELFPAERAEGLLFAVKEPAEGRSGLFTTGKQALLGGHHQDRWGTLESVFLSLAQTWESAVKPSLSLNACFHTDAVGCCQNQVKINSAVWHVRAWFVCFLSLQSHCLPAGYCTAATSQSHHSFLFLVKFSFFCYPVSPVKTTFSRETSSIMWHF